MRIAVYSLTRDRLEYSKIAFASLIEKAGVPFDHWVVDNGSIDGTVDWLLQEYKPYRVTLLNENKGISKASNIALDDITMFTNNYDLVVKFDNDCLVHSENILGQIAEIYEALKFHPKYVLSPRVEGIVNQPYRGRYINLCGRRVGLTAIVGGLFHCVPAEIYKEYRYPEELPLAKGQDDNFCHWAKYRGAEVGYIEGLVVEHYKGTDQQAQDYPEYFKRKFEEEKLVSK